MPGVEFAKLWQKTGSGQDDSASTESGREHLVCRDKREDGGRKVEDQPWRAVLGIPLKGVDGSKP